MSQNRLVCVDASTALAAALQDDPNHAVALALLAQLGAQNVRFCAPALFVYECDSVTRLRVRQNKLSDADAQVVRTLIDALGVQVEYDGADRDRAYQIAEQYDQPRAYNAAYAAHAEARGVELITTDAPFFEAVNGDKRPKSVPPLEFVKLLK